MGSASSDLSPVHNLDISLVHLFELKVHLEPVTQLVVVIHLLLVEGLQIFVPGQGTPLNGAFGLVRKVVAVVLSPPEGEVAALNYSMVIKLSDVKGGIAELMVVTYLQPRPVSVPSNLNRVIVFQDLNFRLVKDIASDGTFREPFMLHIFKVLFVKESIEMEIYFYSDNIVFLR